MKPHWQVYTYPRVNKICLRSNYYIYFISVIINHSYLINIQTLKGDLLFSLSIYISNILKFLLIFLNILSHLGIIVLIEHLTLKFYLPFFQRIKCFNYFPFFFSFRFFCCHLFCLSPHLDPYSFYLLNLSMISSEVLGQVTPLYGPGLCLIFLQYITTWFWGDRPGQGHVLNPFREYILKIQATLYTFYF